MSARGWRTWGSGWCAGPLVLGALTFGCGARSAPASGDGGTGGAGPMTATWPGPVTIPVRALTEKLVNVVSDPTQPLPSAQIVYDTSPPTIRLDAPLDLAVGTGYPTTFSAIVGGTIQCATGWVQGTVSFADVSGHTPAVSATVMNDARVRLAVTDAAKVTLVAKGQVDVASAQGVSVGVHPFELHLTVNAFRPTGAAFTGPSGCASAGVKRVAAGTLMGQRSAADDGTVFEGLTPTLWVTPLDGNGQAVRVANADPLAQVAITIQGPPSSAGLPLDVAGTLASLVFPDASGPVTFTPAVGEPFVVEAVRAEQIERLDLEIQVAGAAGGPLNLVDQASYDRDSWHRKGNRIEPRVKGTYVGGDLLCSPPGYTWFFFDSATPEVCTTITDAVPDTQGFLFDGSSIGQRGRFVTDGTCTLSVRAPRLLAGAGFDKTVTFTARDVTSLLLF